MEQPAPPLRSRRNRFGRFVLRWTVFYLGMVLVLWFIERRLVFVPSSAAEAWEAPVAASTQEVTFPSADGTKIHAWWLPATNPAAGALLLAGGNGGNLSHRGQLAADLNRSLGCGVLVFDYPGYGKNDGKPTEASCYAAGEAAYKWLTDDAKVPTNRIILMGESLGGGTATELATRHDHRALVLLYTFTSLPAAAKYHYPFLPTHTVMRTRFDNLSKIGRVQRPVFIAHGTADSVVPFTHGEALFAAANSPKEFLWVEGAGHDMAVGQVMCDPLAKFLAKNAP
ncbi:MAG: alpha/beta hydrolase [Planctomycetaceae bacterium]|nr:alpha/beta hydrolase [Planctomycetaceae bacterium]